MKIDDMDLYVTETLRERGWSDAHIERMSPDKAFDEYCEWHGLSGWGSRLRRVMRNLTRAAES